MLEKSPMRGCSIRGCPRAAATTPKPERAVDGYQLPGRAVAQALWPSEEGPSREGAGTSASPSPPLPGSPGALWAEPDGRPKKEEPGADITRKAGASAGHRQPPAHPCGASPHCWQRDTSTSMGSTLTSPSCTQPQQASENPHKDKSWPWLPLACCGAIRLQSSYGPQDPSLWSTSHFTDEKTKAWDQQVMGFAKCPVYTKHYGTGFTGVNSCCPQHHPHGGTTIILLMKKLRHSEEQSSPKVTHAGRAGPRTQGS